jgi:hypothetical protein
MIRGKENICSRKKTCSTDTIPVKGTYESMTCFTRPCLLRNIHEEEIKLTFIIKRHEKGTKLQAAFKDLGGNGEAVFSFHGLSSLPTHSQ